MFGLFKHMYFMDATITKFSSIFQRKHQKLHKQSHNNALIEFLQFAIQKACNNTKDFKVSSAQFIWLRRFALETSPVYPFKPLIVKNSQTITT